jgi:hypothetical protein
MTRHPFFHFMISLGFSLIAREPGRPLKPAWICLLGLVVGIPKSITTSCVGLRTGGRVLAALLDPRAH